MKEVWGDEHKVPYRHSQTENKGRSGFVNGEGRGRLYVTCGYPASGKSTWCNEFVREAPLKRDVDCNGNYRTIIKRPRIVISGDDFRVALTGAEYLPRAEHLVFSLMDTAIAACLIRGFDTAVDETCTSKPTIMRMLRLDPNFELVFIETSAEECRRRAVASNREYLIAVIDRLEPRYLKMREQWPAIRADLLQQVEHRLSSEVVLP